MNAVKMKLVLVLKIYIMESLVIYQLVIKKTSKIISPILASNFNYLMEVGKFPDELKLTRKIVMNYLKTIGLYQLYQFLEKSLRKLFTPDCITILYLMEF